MTFAKGVVVVRKKLTQFAFCALLSISVSAGNVALAADHAGGTSPVIPYPAGYVTD